MSSVGSWVAWVYKILVWVKKMAWVAWVHKILAWVKKKGMGQGFGVGDVGLRFFFKKSLLKVSQNLQENICAEVSS